MFKCSTKVYRCWYQTDLSKWLVYCPARVDPDMVPATPDQHSSVATHRHSGTRDRQRKWLGKTERTSYGDGLNPTSHVAWPVSPGIARLGATLYVVDRAQSDTAGPPTTC